MIEEMPALISTLGFPIAICLILLWERHADKCSLRDAVADNTKAIHAFKEEIIRFSERCNGGKKT